MERRKLGGVSISRLGLGTMTWGRDTDENEAAQQLQYFVEAGGNLVDTAAVYADGDAERVLGGFIGTLIKRDDLFIATKGGITFKDGSRQINNSRNELISDLDRSLTRLNVDYVDLWQIHTWDKNTPLE
jgi:aryl-alcohol dehydrogenase-like predicted oxidoreductase